MSGVSQMKLSPSEMHFPRDSATGQSLPYITFCGPKARMRALVAPASVTAPWQARKPASLRALATAWQVHQVPEQSAITHGVEV